MRGRVTLAEGADLEQAVRAQKFARCMSRVATARSREDFRILFDHFAPRVKSFLKRRGAQDSEAEELAQEVMATVWAKAAQFDPVQAAVSTWIFRIARNRQIDAFRRMQRPELDPNDPLLQPAPTETPDVAILRSEADANVRAALHMLPPEQLDLLKASFYDGLPHAEIAKQFELPLGTVKSRIRLAFKKLRGSLSNT